MEQDIEDDVVAIKALQKLVELGYEDEEILGAVSHWRQKSKKSHRAENEEVI